MSVKTIKIGNKEFDRNDFGIFINNYLEDYLKYARKSGKFSKELSDMLRDEVYKAYESGDDFDVTGYSLTNPNNFKNIEVTKNRFIIPDKKIEQGLTGKGSWLAHFIAQAGQTMTPYEKPEDSSKWNRSKHDLGAYFRGNNQDAERIFESMDREGQNTEGASRKFAERDEYLFKHLLNHLKQIQNLGFTFNENDDIYDDNYANTLQELIDLYSEKDAEGKFITDELGNRKFNKSGNFNRSDILSKLQSLGAVGEGKYDYIRAFTSDQYEYLTEEERAKREEERIKKEQEKAAAEKTAAEKTAALKAANEENFRTTALTNWVDANAYNKNYRGKIYDFNQVNYDSNGSFTNTNKDVKNINHDDMAKAYNILISMLDNINPNNLVNNSDNKENNDKENINDTISINDTLMTTINDDFINGINRDYILPYVLEKDNSNQFTDLGNNQYLINKTFSEKNNGWGLVYNKNTNDVRWEYLGDKKYKDNNDIVSQLTLYFNKYIQNKYTTDQNDSTKTYDQYYNPNLFPTHYQSVFNNKKGGTLIKKYLFGDEVMPVSFKNTNEITEKTKERAKENNRTPKEQQELDRPFEYVFNGNDITQLITIGANLGSMFMGPISGALVGAGATVTDFINDIDRDGFQWRDAKNLVTGLGMDAIGMIPVVGDAFGTMGKVTRSLVLYVPKIIGYIGTAGSLANTPEVINSLKKIGNEKLTVQDWKNIADAINLIVTGARGTKNTIYSARAKHASLSKPTDGDDFKLLIEIANKNGKDNKLLILDGADARTIRDNPTPEKVNEVLNQEKYKDLLGYVAVPESKISNIRIRTPWKKIDNPANPNEQIRAGFSNMVYTQDPSIRLLSYHDPIKFAKNYSKRLKEINALIKIEPNNRRRLDYTNSAILQRQQTTSISNNSLPASGSTSGSITRSNQQSLNSNSQIWGDDIYGSYLKKGGSIDRNKLNKFLNYEER